jgi:hypothetical protein
VKCINRVYTVMRVEQLCRLGDGVLHVTR